MVNMDNVIIQDGSIVLFRNMRTIDFTANMALLTIQKKNSLKKKNDSTISCQIRKKQKLLIAIIKRSCDRNEKSNF